MPRTKLVPYLVGYLKEVATPAGPDLWHIQTQAGRLVVNTLGEPAKVKVDDPRGSGAA